MNADEFVDPESDVSDDQGFDEPGFMDWYTRWADTIGIDPNPDDPNHHYDYRAAYAEGDEPELGADGAYHWPSRHKSDDHPNRFIDGVDTRSGERLPDPDTVGEIAKTEPPINESKDGRPAVAEKPAVEINEDEWEPEAKAVEIKEEDWGPEEPVTFATGFNPFESSMKKLSRKPPAETVTPEQKAREDAVKAAQKEARRIQQEEANAQASPLIDAYFAHMVPENIRKTDTFYSAAAGAAVDESGVIWDRRRSLALKGKDISPEEQARLEWLDQISKYSTTAEGFLANVMPSAGQLIGQQVNALFSGEMNPYSTTAAAMAGAAGMATLSGPLSLVTVPAAMAAAGTATMAAMQFQRSKAVEGGHAFKEAIEWTDENGEQIDRKTAAVVADIIGSVNGALELVGMGASLQALKGVKGLMGIKSGGIRPLLKESDVLRKELIKLARNYIGGVAGETGTEVLQEMPAMAAEAKISGKSVVDALTNEAARLNYEDIAMKVAPGMALLGLGGAAGHAVSIKSSMEQAKRLEEQLPIEERTADVIEAGLATGAVTQDALADYYYNAKTIWPDNPVLPRLEAMMAEPPGDTQAASMYTQAGEEDIASLTTYLSDRLPAGAKIEVEPSTERRGMGEIQRIGDQTGTRVQFFKGHGEADGLNGVYDPETNTIWINESAANPFAVVLGHETLHQMKQEHADLYENLAELAKGKELGFSEYLNTLNISRADRGLPALSLEDALAREEFMADWAGDQFKSPEFWEKVNKLNPSLGQRMAQYVADLIEKIRTILGAGGDEYLSDLEEMQDALAKTYVEFARRKGEKVQDLTSVPLGQKIIDVVGAVLSPGSAEAAAHAGVKTKAPKAKAPVEIIESEWGPPEAQGKAQTEEAPKGKGEEAAPAGAPPGEAKQAEFDRLWGELTDKERKHLDFSVDDDELSIDEKIAFVKAEMTKRDKPVKPFAYQDANQEKVIHSEWEKGNNYRFILEGAGDIFRELAKGGDAGYIREKVKRILAHIEEEGRGIHADDSFKTSAKANKAYFDKMRQQWKDQPVENDRQEKARQLNLAMLDGDFETAARLIDEILGKKGPVTAYRKEVQDYRKKNDGRVVIPDGLEAAWEHIKSQEAPEWFGAGKWSREEFDILVAKVDGGKKLTYNQFQRFMDLIDVMDAAVRTDKDLAGKIATQKAADALEEKGWTPVMEDRTADSIPEGAQVQINGKVYKNAGFNDDGFVHLVGEEDLLLEPYENVKVEGLKGGKVQKDDIAASLKKNDFEIDVVAMDDQGNTAKIKAMASEAVAENDKQQAFARRLLECLNS